jgi:ribonucleoside-triphosphate reductase
MEKYKLKDSFVNKYKKVKPPFGFNGLGEITYYRSYSRIKEDGTNEQWYETVRRVVEGTYSIQKRHITKNGLGWDEDKAHSSAEEMYDRMFNMKFLPPGRGIYHVGAPMIEDRGHMEFANNCAFISTKDIDKEYSKPFCFMMSMSLAGVGTGFDVKGKDKLKVIEPASNGFTYIIPDSREGWVESLRYLLDAYFQGKSLPTFDYSQIREKGAPIKTAGGTAPGPETLMKLHTDLKRMLSTRIGEKLSSEDIADIMNMIGVCVVSGGVRRTAQIALGDAKDKEFMSLKDYTWNGEEYEGNKAHRAAYGWTSNNTVICDVGQNYSELAKQTAKNGEPGYFWLDNAKDYSRMSDDRDYKDHRAEGVNPCGEQTLESYEMCCLVEVFPTAHKDIKDFKRTLKFAYLYGKTITLGMTSWVETNRVQLRNRRIGTSVSGVAQFIGANGIDTLKYWIEEGFDTIRYYDMIYSDWLAVPKSIKTTSIKPSGTVSLLAGVTPGIHYPISNYYIRRVRINATSNLIPYLSKAGYNIEPDVSNPDHTLVVDVPIKIENCRTLEEVSIWEQCELAAFMQAHWADNQVSCTVTFKSEEASQIENVLQYYQYRLKSISFLPSSSGTYAQMPYEAISKEKYESLVKNLKGLTIKELSEKAEPDKYCDGDSCVV